MIVNPKELKSITVLYVEDDVMVRTQTLNFFTKIFKKVYIGKDGEEGLELFTAHQDEIEIVVSDINMPKLDGLEMVSKIKDISATNIPVIITTAHNESNYLKDAIDLNIDKYITKPLQMKELTLNIANLVLRYRKRKTLESLALNLVQENTKNSKLQSDLGNVVQQQEQKIKYYETLIENFVFMLNLDKTGNIISASNKFRIFFDFSEDEIIGTNINTLKCEKFEGDNFQHLMLKAIHTKKTVSAKVTFNVKEGAASEFDVIMTAQYGADGFVNGYVLYLDMI